MDNAFYYKGRYYLLPDTSEDVKSFCENTDLSLPLRLTRLKENLCMAPYFVKEEQVQEEVVIDSKRHIYPVEVSVLDRAEYDTKLSEIVGKTCKGCMRFGGNAEDVTGHHSEISLDGMCFEKQKLPYFAFFYAAQHFWEIFQQNEEKIRKSIAMGRADSVIEFIASRLGFMIVPYIAVLFRDGRYIIIFSSMADQTTSALTTYLLSLAPESLKEHWDFYDYLPKDIFYYVPEKEEYDLNLTPPTVVFSPEQSDRLRFQLIVKIAPFDGGNFDPAFENFLYLCATLGENRLLACVSVIDFAPKEITDESVSAEDFSKIVESTYNSDEMRSFFDDWQSYSFVLAGQSVTTRHAALSIDLISGGKKTLCHFERFGVPVGTLSLKVDYSNPNWTKDYEHLLDLIKEKLCKTGLIYLIGTRSSKSRLCVDFLVMDKPIANKAIRALTPPLRSFDAKYIVRDGAKTISTRVDFIM